MQCNWDELFDQVEVASVGRLAGKDMARTTGPGTSLIMPCLAIYEICARRHDDWAPCVPLVLIAS
jgi:hypothetical protein